MLRHMAKEAEALDRVFRALADPTRRAVLERLGRRPAAVSELAAPFRMALPSFVQHLRVLEGCGLIRTRKSGRVRTCELAPRSLRPAEGWLARQRSIWEKRLDAYLLKLKEASRRA
jgi:DNA-binding transcriptional ArsR family regulator